MMSSLSQSACLAALLGERPRIPELFEWFGSSSTGKHQLCMELCAKVAMSSSNRPSSPSVVYIDTKNAFNAQRVAQFCNKDTEALERIMVFREYKFLDVLHLLDSFVDETASPVNMEPVRLIILSSVPSIFYPAVTEKSSWTQIADALVNAMERIVDKFKMTGIMVNNAVTDRTTGDCKPALGSRWDSRIRNRIKFSRTQTDCVFRLDCERLEQHFSPVKSITFRVTDKDVVYMENGSDSGK